jgi:hypothetical protein
MRAAYLAALVLVLLACASLCVSDPVVRGDDVVVAVVRSRCPICGDEPFVVRCSEARCRWQSLGTPEDAESLPQDASTDP